MPEAAHQTHLVKHGFAMIGLIAGVVVGAAVAVAVVGTGGGALVLVAAVGTGISAGGGIGQAAGQIMSHFVPGPDTGPIIMGVPTVLIEFFPAAVVTSPAACTGIVVPHPGSVIAEGSGSVFIGGFPAARIGDQLTCGAKVGYGCKSVDIGGGTVSYLEIDSEVPGWVNWGLTAIGMVSGFGLLRMAGVGVLGAAARIGGATAGGIGGGMGGGWAAEKAGFAPGSLGHDLASIGGSFLGGAAGFKGGGKISGKGKIADVTYEEFKGSVKDFSKPENEHLAKQSYELYKDRKFGELEKLFNDHQLNKAQDGNIYPPNNGAVGKPQKRVVQPGETFDRYGSEKGYRLPDDKIKNLQPGERHVQGGRYVSPSGTEFGKRALPSSKKGEVPTTSVVQKPFHVREAEVMPWFGEEGGGTQQQLPVSVDKLKSRGFLK